MSSAPQTIPRPPSGYLSWLDYAVATFDAGVLERETMFEDTPGPDQSIVRAAARAELTALRMTAPPSGAVILALKLKGYEVNELGKSFGALEGGYAWSRRGRLQSTIGATEAQAWQQAAAYDDGLLDESWEPSGS